MRILLLAILFFANTLLAEFTFDDCQSESLSKEISLLSSAGSGFELFELLFNANCAPADNPTLLLDSFNKLLKNIYLVEKIPDIETQDLLFLQFITRYPTLLFRLQESGAVTDLTDVFIENMVTIEEISIKFGLEEYYVDSINVIAMYVRNVLGKAAISYEMSALAERYLVNSKKENILIFSNQLPLLVNLKLNKLQTLIQYGDIDTILSEFNQIIIHSKSSTQASKQEADVIFDLLNRLTEFGGKLSKTKLNKTLQVRLYDLVISNPQIDFDEDFLLSFLLFLFGDAISDDPIICKEELFINLRNDSRASSYMVDYIETMCFGNIDRLLEKITYIATKYKSNSVYKETFNQLARSIIFPNLSSQSGKIYTMDELQEVIFDLSLIYASTNAFSDQYGLSEFIKSCEESFKPDLCLNPVSEINELKKAFLIDFPEEINISNIENTSVIFVAAEDLFFDNFDAMAEFTENFLKNTKIIFPTVDDIISTLDIQATSNDSALASSQVIQQFSKLFFWSKKYYFPDTKEDKTFFAELCKSYSEFFMTIGSLYFETASKNYFFNTLNSEKIKDLVLDAAHSAVIAHQNYEYHSGTYDFQVFPVLALDLIMKSQRSDFDDSLYLTNFSNKDLNANNLNDIQDLKSHYASNYRISNYLLLKNELNKDEFADLKFLKDINDRKIQDLSIQLSNLNQRSDGLFPLNIMSNLKQNEVLEYHFAISDSYENIIFRVDSNSILITSYELSDLESMEIYEEFSNPAFIGKERVKATLLSDKIHKILKYNDKVQRVYIAAEGRLRFIPFHALQYKSKYLIESFQVAYLPSINSFLEINQKDKPLNFFGIGNPEFQSIKSNLLKKRGIEDGFEFVSLEETQDEIETIAKEFQITKLLFSKEATKENFLNNAMLHSNSLIYFGTHNLPYGNNISDEPGLVLSPNPKSLEPSILTISDIISANFNDSIIALAACKTFDSAYEDKEAYSGIAQSFLMSGASGLYLTMWEIESLSASYFNKSLFGRIEDGYLNLPELIQNTSISFINNSNVHVEAYQDPFFWAPYIYLGK